MEHYGPVHSGGGPVYQGNQNVQVYNQNRGNDSRTEILDWISTIGASKLRTTHVTAQNKAVIENPGAWIFEEPKFKAWLVSEVSSILWLRGEMGTGKTVLTSTVINHIGNLYNASRKGAMAYFYIVGTSEELQNPANMLRSILRQLADTDRGIAIAQEEWEKRPRPELSNRLVQNLIRKLVEFYGEDPTTIIIDAVDEGLDAHISLRILTSVLSSAKGLLRLFITGRPDRIIGGLLSGQPNIRIDPHKTERDVARYIDEQIQSQLAGRFAPEHPLPGEIMRSLKDRANGMFRWVELSVEYVCDKARSEVSVREALCELPPTVIGMYTKLMSEIEAFEDERNKLLAIQVLKWVLTAPCSLTPRALIEAVCSISPLLESFQLTKDDVLVACNHLVKWDETKDEFDFGHISVSTFLQDYNPNEFGHEARHSFLAKMCLNAIHECRPGSNLSPTPTVSLKDIQIKLMLAEGRMGFTGESRAHQMRTFRDYAIGYWAYHCEESKLINANDDNSLKASFNTFFGRLGETDLFMSWRRSLPHLVPSCRDLILSRWYDAFESFEDSLNEATSAVISPALVACIFNFAPVVETTLRTPESRAVKNVNGMTMLHLASKYGHEILVKMLLANRYPVYEQDHDRRTALRFAAMANNESIMRILLDARSNVDDQTGFAETVLQKATADGNESFVRFLLDKGANVRKETREGETPLHAAVDNGNETIVRLILEKKPNINSRGRNFQWPLHRAINSGNDKLSLLLLQAGARVDGRDARGATPLSLAAKKGHTEIVRQLLEFRASIDTKNGLGNTPFWEAAAAGCLPVALFLYRNGAYPYVRDSGMSSPLCAAAERGHEMLVAQLVAEGVDINAPLELGRTELCYAASRGSPVFTKWLLANGADVHVRDCHGWNPLHVAAGFSLENLKVLVRKYDDLNAKTSKGETALMIVAKSNLRSVFQSRSHGGSLECVGPDGTMSHVRQWQPGKEDAKEQAQILLDAGADLLAVDGNGKTAIWWAEEVGNWELAEFLKAATDAAEEEFSIRPEST